MLFQFAFFCGRVHRACFLLGVKVVGVSKHYSMRKKLKTAIKAVKGGGDLKKLNRLKVQLDRLNAIGGLKSVVPSEGITFVFKGKLYKYTGAFAPANQILGMLKFV